MKRTTLDLWVGLFAALGCAALLFLALRAANLTTSVANEPYTLYAEFDNIGGLGTICGPAQCRPPDPPPPPPF